MACVKPNFLRLIRTMVPMSLGRLTVVRSAISGGRCSPFGILFPSGIISPKNRVIVPDYSETGINPAVLLIRINDKGCLGQNEGARLEIVYGRAFKRTHLKRTPEDREAGRTDADPAEAAIGNRGRSEQFA